MNTEFGTWHHGLIARWWAEFNVAEPEELTYFGAAIRKFGEPALDIGCGTGRILFPLLAEGLDVREALKRAYRHLEPGGVLLITHQNLP